MSSKHTSNVAPKSAVEKATDKGAESTKAPSKASEQESKSGSDAPAETPVGPTGQIHPVSAGVAPTLTPKAGKETPKQELPPSSEVFGEKEEGKPALPTITPVPGVPTEDRVGSTQQPPNPRALQFGDAHTGLTPELDPTADPEGHKSDEEKQAPKAKPTPFK